MLDIPEKDMLMLLTTAIQKASLPEVGVMMSLELIRIGKSYEALVEINKWCQTSYAHAQHLKEQYPDNSEIPISSMKIYLRNKLDFYINTLSEYRRIIEQEEVYNEKPEPGN